MRRVFEGTPSRVIAAFGAVVLSAVLSVAAVAGGVITNGNRISDIERVRDAVCNLRDDQIRRVHNTEVFLREHPNGIPGISSELLRVDLRDRRRVVSALEPLKCPPPTQR